MRHTFGKEALENTLESLAKRVAGLPAVRHRSGDVKVRDGFIELTFEEGERLWRVSVCPSISLDDETVVSQLRVGMVHVLCLGDECERVRNLRADNVEISCVEAAAHDTVLNDHLAKVIERGRTTSAPRSEISRAQYELEQLLETGRALSKERNIDTLLELILRKSRELTSADAGSIYVVELMRGEEAEPQRLRFKLSQNDSCEFESKEFTMPVSSTSIAGAAVLSKRSINIADVSQLAEDSPYNFDASFDRRVGYNTRSMITVPMLSAESEVIGVIQLINRKRHEDAKLSDIAIVDTEVVPFDQRAEDLLVMLASQAGVALENTLLYSEIRDIFEGFVHASVQAIEQRDPTTSGHSRRVSLLSCELARVVDRTHTGPYASATFRDIDVKELEYAAMLHDFGKIGVREHVLVKAKKLYPAQLELIKLKFDFAQRSIESEILNRKLQYLEDGRSAKDLSALDDELAIRAGELRRAWQIIQKVSEPSLVEEDVYSRLDQLENLTYIDIYGQRQRLVGKDELECLRVRKGSLNAEEIEEIRSHVVHTIGFLSKIPWGRALARIPEIAGAHHELLNGTGYPKGLTAEQIPLSSKIMTVADIYDALTASDRPYKRAVPRERALSILEDEVRLQKIDHELFRLFCEASVFQVVES